VSEKDKSKAIIQHCICLTMAENKDSAMLWHMALLPFTALITSWFYFILPKVRGRRLEMLNKVGYEV